MEAAPLFHCAACDRRIGKERMHFLSKAGAVLCVGCVDQGDLYDQMQCSGSRAAIAATLGIWPRDK